jgi:acetyl-CoA acyltransferase
MEPKMKEAVIVTAVRSPLARSMKGTLRDTRPDELCATVVKAAIERTPGLGGKDVDDLVVGCAFPEGEQGNNVARIIGTLAGLPDEVPAMTLNRFCSSGLQAVADAARQIMVGWSDVVIAGGVESMTMIPMTGVKPSISPKLAADRPDALTSMGVTAENVAKRFGIAREAQDEFALRSHRLAMKAIVEGRFKDEIIPIDSVLYEGSADGRPLSRPVRFEIDEMPRADTTLEKLAALKPAFDPKGSVTAGNSSPLTDGAAATVLMSRERAAALGLKPLAVFRGFATAGVAPDIMGIGPVPAVRKLLAQQKLDLEDIDLVEINEAFASQSIYCMKELGLDPLKTNVNGGAIALGHPLGCTGARLTATLLHELKKRGGRYGIVTMCIGGGMGAAGLFERV